MSTTRIQKPWHEAAARLLQAVNVAPIEELRSPIAKELGLNKEETLPVLLDHVGDLKQLAMLGYPGAIQSLVSIGRDISTLLATLSPHAEAPTCDASNNALAHNNSSESRDDQSKKDRRSEINQAAAHLHDVVIDHYECCKTDFHNWQTELPETAFSFPLEILLGRSEPSDSPLKLVSNFCNGLIQRRFNSEIGAQMLLQTTGAWYWPVVVSAQHYKGNRKLKDCFPNLNIGESIPIDIFSGTKTGTPKELATSVFKELERERTAPRSKSHIEEFRRAEENNVPAPLKELIKQAGRKGATPQCYSGATLSIWDIRNIWIRKAALLPELCAETVSQWVDAAYARAVSACGGDLENYEWIDCISDKVASLGSVDAALRRVITEGFKAVAKD